MAESQNVEWKESWRDEYLKWVCGFANAQGGRICIGIDDSGKVVGVPDAKTLLESIPNKIQTTMGIVADVNLVGAGNGNEYIEIDVSPSSYPINYKGEYHYRSGSTKQQLKGAALTEFLMSKVDIKWDAAAMPQASVDDLDSESFEIFRREAIRSGRMSSEDLNMSNEDLLDSLGLISQGVLKRAAVMLFGRNLERFVTGCHVKIGLFESQADLKYQDELSGSLILIASRVVDLIYLKYLKARISYDKELRIETYSFPRAAVREAVFNALIHCNWAEGVPIQIRVEEDALYVSNSCILPRGWTVDTLLQRHASKPFNPDIANVFFRAGYVEVWGRGIQKICDSCEAHGSPKPEIQLTGDCITVKLIALPQTTQSTTQTTQSKKSFANLSTVDTKILEQLVEDSSMPQRTIAAKIGETYNTVRYRMERMEKQGIISKEKHGRCVMWTILVETLGEGADE